ncbi:MAG: carboxypeptidase regulatory-like domain-containing protein [Candidatus Aminicenantes bacterium]|nr:carboxypeptidase regulatory-like domain-containing protein [Candidatus Aminicenantes bacterium]
MRKRVLKNNITWITLSLFFLFTLPSPAAAPGTGVLKGFIYKKDGNTPRWGVQVLLKNLDTGEMFESNVTDGVGNYELRDVPTGDYQVMLMSKDRDYKIKKVDFMVKVFSGKTSTISFSLKKKGGAAFFLFKPCILVAILAAVFAFVVSRK